MAEEKNASESRTLEHDLLESLRRIAEREMRKERANHTLQPTALVNEAWVRLAHQKNLDGANHNRYLAAAARTMRQILVDHARRKKRLKRGGPFAVHVTLNVADFGVADEGEQNAMDILVIEDSLNLLQTQNSRAAAVFELRFFGGADFQEIAEQLGVSVRTAKGDWAFARAWLSREISANSENEKKV